MISFGVGILHLLFVHAIVHILACKLMVTVGILFVIQVGIMLLAALVHFIQHLTLYQNACGMWLTAIKELKK
jgi:hypothetical protein